jgi:hypothetical protein
MLKLLLLFALKVTSPDELTCSDSVREMMAPRDLYIAGVEQEGMMLMAAQGQIVYLNGPGVSSVKAGVVKKVVRPEGKVRDPITGAPMGVYYRDIGTIHIEAVQQDSATARVLVSCQEMLKGDVIAPYSAKVAMQFDGNLSNELTRLPQNGLISSIILAKDDARELAAGNFCFIGLGKRDGVAPGDRFTAFRPNPSFDSGDMVAGRSKASSSYSSVRDWLYRFRVNELLRQRQLPPVILGDIVIVDAGDSVSTGKIINSLSEMHLGDLIVKR